MDQALDRAVDNGVKNLVVQPTHLMHGAEYDELTEAVEATKIKFESVTIAEPLLGEVGDDAIVNDDKKAVAEDHHSRSSKTAGYDSLDAQRKTERIRIHGTRNFPHCKDILQPDAETDERSGI